MKVAIILLLIACGLSSTFAYVLDQASDAKMKEIGAQLQDALAELERIKGMDPLDRDAEEVKQINQHVAELMRKLQDYKETGLSQSESINSILPCQPYIAVVN